MSAFHFLRPAWLLATLPLLLLLWLLWRRQTRHHGWKTVVSPALLPHLLVETVGAGGRLPWMLLGLGWLLAVIALAGPTWERLPQVLYRAPFDRVLVLDVSPSMAAADVQPSRLARARLAIRRLLAESGEGRNALVVFAGEPHLVVPLTEDVATIEALLPALSPKIMPVAGDRAAPALRQAGELLRRVGSARGQVLLLSDGVADPTDSLNAVRALRAAGVTTSVLGVGTRQGAPVAQADGGFAADAQGAVSLARFEPSGLKALAAAGGGHYLHLGNGQLAALFPAAVDRNPEHAKAARGGARRWAEEGPWLLLPLLLLAAAAFRRGWLGVLLLLVLTPPQPAAAFSWRDLWLRPDQQASELLRQGNAAAAAKRFRDPRWRATAHYQAGDYAAAAKEFAAQDVDSLYNKGNALARAGQLQAAKQAYDKALARGGEHPDVRFNRDLVAKLLRQRQTPAEGGQPAAPGSETGTPARQTGATPPEAGAAGDQAQTGKGAQQSAPAPATGSPAGNAERRSSGGSDESDENADRKSQVGTGASDARASAGSSGGGGQPASHPDAALPAGRGSQPQPPATTTNAGRKPEPSPAVTANAGRKPEPPPAAAGNAGASANEARTANADSAERARADLGATQPVGGDARAHGQTAGGGSMLRATAPARGPRSEQDLALQQWLQQVPDDPAGLLRRKFMLDHLRRQRGGQTP